MKVIIPLLSFGLALSICALCIGCADDDDNSTTGAGVNRAPVIRSVTANPDTLTNESYFGPWAELNCLATDPEGESLRYLWTCRTGNFGGDVYGQSTIWEATANSPSGAVYIALTVSDGREIDVDSVRIIVR